MVVTAVLALYEVRWLSGAKEGVCWIRATCEDDARDEFRAHAWFYGVPHANPRIVWARPVDRARKRLDECV